MYISFTTTVQEVPSPDYVLPYFIYAHRSKSKNTANPKALATFLHAQFEIQSKQL